MILSLIVKKIDTKSTTIFNLYKVISLALKLYNKTLTRIVVKVVVVLLD